MLSISKKNIKRLNKDPDRFARTLDIEELNEIIVEANDLYYNSPDFDNKNNTKGIITDYGYDALCYYLKKKRPKRNKKYNKIGAIPRKNKSQLPFYMPSLDKVKLDGGLFDFLGKSERYCLSLKLDGVSGMVVYKDKKVSNIYLRGNGEIGRDITFVKNYIKFPTSENYHDIVIRGEFVMKKNVWYDKWDQSSASQRNFVSGRLNSKDAVGGLKDIDFVAFDIIYIDENTIPRPSKSFRILKREGFNVVKHFTKSFPLCDEISTIYQEEYEEHEYFIDGIVIAINSKRKVPNVCENPRHTIAFKMNLEEQIRETKVVDIIWQISRHGRYVPVVEYKPVFIEGVRIHRATGHNAFHVLKKWCLKKGTKITVTRSGGVIPKIVSVIDENESSTLYPSDEYEWKWSGKDIIVKYPDECEEVHIKRMIHFFQTLNIPGIREGMIKRMYNCDEVYLTCLEEIIEATKRDFLKVKGIGVKTAEKYVDGIEKSISNARLYKILLASNCFERGLGKTYLRLISTSLPHFIEKVPRNTAKAKRKLMSLKGIGPKRADTFLNGLEKFHDFKCISTNIATIVATNIENLKKIKREGYNRKIKYKNFVFTNMNNGKLEDYILDHQGSLQNYITNETKAVICGDLLSITSKMKIARSKRIPIYTTKEFIERFDIFL